MLSSKERSLRAKIGAHKLHATHDPKETSAKGRQAFLDSFLTQVDPERTLPEQERQRRARHALQAHMTRLALASARARRTEAQGGSNVLPDSLIRQAAMTVQEADDARAS